MVYKTQIVKETGIKFLKFNKGTKIYEFSQFYTT